MGILDGIRVLDVTRYVAGPVATALLGDLGAEVIRIEPPGGGDDRGPLPFAEGFHGGVGFVSGGRNKKGLTLDLAAEKGREIFDRLLATADIVVANLPPKSVTSLGLDYERLASVKKDIILVHLTTFGTSGPYKDKLGFDAIAQVMCGLTHLSGDPGKPMKNAAPWVDTATGYLGAFGALAALRHRDATGEGQKVEANLLQTAMSVGNYFLIEQYFDRPDRAGTGNRAQSGGPADLVPTKDGAVYVVALGNPMFKRFAKMVGRPELVDDPRFANDELRAEHGAELSDVAAAWSSRLSTAEAMEQMESWKIPGGPMLTPQQALDDPHVQETFLDHVDVDGLSKPVPYIRTPAIFSKTPGTIRKGPPRAGEDNDALLASAGYSDAEIAALRTANII